MKLRLLLAMAACVGTGLGQLVYNEGKCHVGDKKDAQNRAGLSECVEQLTFDGGFTKKVDSWNCGGSHFELKRKWAWLSPEECVKRCASCLAQAVEAGQSQGDRSPGLRGWGKSSEAWHRQARQARHR